MARAKSCKNCKWLWDFDAHEYTGKCCGVRFKGMPEWYVGTIHEMKDLIPCRKFESKYYKRKRQNLIGVIR